jgi:hypothetical protein
MQFKMIPQNVVDAFRAESRALFPPGAFDARLRRMMARDAALNPDRITSEKPAVADEELPHSVQKQLSALSPGARDQLRRFLSKDQQLPMTEQPPPPTGGTSTMSDQEPDEEEEGGGGLNEKICALLEEYGLPDEIIDKVRALGSDDLAVHQPDVHIHKDHPITTQQKAYDRKRRTARDEQYGAGSSAGSSAYPAEPSHSPKPRRGAGSASRVPRSTTRRWLAGADARPHADIG